MSILKLHRQGLFVGTLVAAMAIFSLPPPVAATSISASNQQAGAYALDPPLGTAGAAPLVMLNISRDQALFSKAYNDFSDLNNDGTLETTYSDAIDYAGYFDPQKCYTYSDTDGYFSPDSAATGAHTHYCTDMFSGNFLNWASMTRMDEVRKILYGGKRSTDTASATVLERAYLPTDAHSFAKYYSGSDMSSLVPSDYVGNTSAPTTTASAATTVDALNENSRNYARWRVDGLGTGFTYEIGDQLQFTAKNDGTNPLTIVTGIRDINNGKPRVRLELGQFSSNCNSVNPTGNGANNCIVQLKSKSGWNVVNLSRTGLTICNTTVKGSSTNSSQTNTAPPLMRFAKGDYALWGANEKKQCQWRSENSNTQSGFDNGFLSNGNRAAFSGVYANAENPVLATGMELTARVKVCVSGLIGTEKCKQYPDATNTNNPYKPYGLLQKYGEAGEIKFGLVTPSYDKNVSGGVLRAALPGPGTNSGNFITSEISPTTGQKTGNAGIISTLDKLRIYGYRYDQADSYQNDDGCPYQQTGIGGAATTDVTEGKCSSWGNPMAESYVEALRYLAHGTANANFNPGTGGKDAALGLSVVTWNDPISEANYCAALNVININASAISYDSDQLGGFSDLGTGKTVRGWTKLVGDGEGITGKSWFVGNSSASYNGTDANLCSAKTVANFGDVLGLCPEVPALKGSYDIAGAAYGAHVNRIRNLGNDSNGNPIVPADDKTSLKVTTFGVQLATNTPQIRVPVPGNAGKFITIIPAYRLVLPTGVGGGELVDFKVLSQSTDGTTARGTFYANWEDSFAGGDFDQDMWGIISYEVTSTTVKVTTKPVSASTNNGQGFGYIINGTTQDGPHFHSGIYNFNYTDPQNISVVDAAGNSLLNTTNINASGGCVNCTVDNQATTAVYTVGSTSAGILQDPLLYASKWGGFKIDTSKADGTDTPANDADPTDHTKWDADGDGIPDDYFLVTNPAKLEESLDTLFRKILAKIASGTAAAVVATSSNGVGLTYQALYEQEHKDDSGRVATWAGSLAGFWTDAAGYLREDANHNFQLDDYTVDPVVIFSYQSGAQKTIVNRYFSDDPKVFHMGTAIPVELDQVNTVWNARDWLWSPTLKVDANRTYTSAATNTSTTAGGRYIFTWIDKNHNGKVDTDETVPFEWSSFSGTSTNGTFTDQLYRFLNSNDGASNGEANKLVRWVRGEEIAGLRNRTVDYNAANPNRILRLGDIINSTPLAVSTPAESYDLLYNDSTYAAFRSTYRNRRQVIYVGANDGMIHAFNGGFYNTSCQRLTVQTDSAVCTTASPNTPADLTGTQTAHPLGAELWAYVPDDLLPHLRWLADPNYRHVYYVDGSPIAFDAKVWGDGDTTHVGGWGTIMVVPFRLGGGTITVNATNSGTDNLTSESAYVVMDITNPEAPPTLLAEIKMTGQRAVSVPAVVVVRQASSGSPNKFFLAVGNGPTDATRVSSSNPLSVSIYDVESLKNHNVSPVRTFNMQTAAAQGGGEAVNSFSGDLIASDYDLNGLAESLYFGSVRSPATATGTEFGGSFWKIAINGNPDPQQWTATQMLSLRDDTTSSTDIGRPVTIRPTLGRNNRGAPMVFFGTGRLFNSPDKATSGQQRIYGIIDTSLLSTGDAQYSTAPIPASKVADVTDIDVYTDGSIDNGLSDTTSFSELSKLFDTTDYLGWYRNLSTSGSNPSERVVSAQTLLGSVLLTNTYVPGTSICTGLGTSATFGLNYKTGTADPNLTFFGSTTSGGKQMVNPSASLGQGLPAPPSLHLGSSDQTGKKKVTACVQTSTGAIICKDIVTLNPVTSSEQSWREPVEN